jgi:hypothetical protein
MNCRRWFEVFANRAARALSQAVLLLAVLVLAIFLGALDVSGNDRTGSQQLTAQQTAAIQAAAQLVLGVGWKEYAENILEYLESGKIRIGQWSHGAPSAEYEDGMIYLDSSLFLSYRGTDSPTDFGRLAHLASILLHEKYHAEKQSTLLIALSRLTAAGTVTRLLLADCPEEVEPILHELKFKLALLSKLENEWAQHVRTWNERYPAYNQKIAAANEKYDARQPASEQEKSELNRLRAETEQILKLFEESAIILEKLLAVFIEIHNDIAEAGLKAQAGLKDEELIGKIKKIAEDGQALIEKRKGIDARLKEKVRSNLEFLNNLDPPLSTLDSIELDPDGWALIARADQLATELGNRFTISYGQIETAQGAYVFGAASSYVVEIGRLICARTSTDARAVACVSLHVLMEDRNSDFILPNPFVFGLSMRNCEVFGVSEGPCPNPAFDVYTSESLIQEAVGTGNVRASLEKQVERGQVRITQAE